MINKGRINRYKIIKTLLINVRILPKLTVGRIHVVSVFLYQKMRNLDDLLYNLKLIIIEIELEMKQDDGILRCEILNYLKDLIKVNR